MAPLFLAFVLLPLLELFLLIRVGRVIGPWYTLLFVVVVGALGAVIARTQGRRVIEEWRASLREGRVPEDGVLGGILMLLGAVLLITPGILTDVVGLLLLLPWTRRYLSIRLRAALERQLLSGTVQLHTYGFSPAPMPPRSPTSRVPPGAPRVAPRGDVIDTEGEEVE